MRSEQRRRRKQPTLTEAGVKGSAIAASTQRPCDPVPHEHADWLRRSLESLASVNRAVLEGLLRGQSQSQMAAHLGVSEGTISRRKVQAVQQLRSMLCDLHPLHVSRAESPAAACIKGWAEQGQPCLPFVTVQYETTSASRIMIQRHHRWYAIGCLCQGQVDLTWIRNGRQQANHQTPGTCNFFCPEDVDDEFLWDPSSETSFHTVLIPPEYFHKTADSECVCHLQDMRPVFGFHDAAVKDTILSMRRHRNDGDDLAQECNGRSLVARICELQGCGKPDWLKDESVFTARESRKVREYVDAHLHGQITLQQLAQTLGLSKGHFNRKCHRSIGVTPSRLVTLRRVQRAVDLLRSTDTPLEELARITGFCSPSHFTNTFRAILGIPPSRFRTELLCR